MKTRILLTAIIASCLILSSCEKGPLAGFEASNTIVETEEIIDFTNTPLRAHNFEWNFGDGEFSIKSNPSHFYTDPGVYEVSLKAFKGDMMEDRKSVV